MKNENQQIKSGFSRRTALKAAAWSVPVVAAAAAVPAYAASGEIVDLAIGWMQSGATIVSVSPDGTRLYEINVPTGVEISNVGTVDVAAGALLTLSLDARLFGDITASQDGTPLAPAGSSTTGNVTTASFLLPALPAGSAVVTVRPGFGTSPDPADAPWFEDVNPYTVTVTASAATETNTANNTVVAEARYEAVSDITASATWSTREVANASDPASPFVIDVPETATITMVSGATATSASMGFNFARSMPDYGRIVENLEVTSAVLDGVDVLSQVTQSDYIKIDGISLAVGQSLTLGFAVTMTTTPISELSANGPGASGWASVPGDTGSNSMDSPQWGI